MHGIKKTWASPPKSLWFNIDEYGSVISTHALIIFDALKFNGVKAPDKLLWYFFGKGWHSILHPTRVFF